MESAIAGILVGRPSGQVVVFDPHKKTRMVVDVRGHNLYCKKCRRSDMIKGIAIPDASRDNTSILTVLAVGDQCGKRRKLSPTQKRMRLMVPHVELAIEPLDQLLFPDDHEWGIMRSPYNENEYFVDECLAMANLGKENTDG